MTRRSIPLLFAVVLTVFSCGPGYQVTTTRDRQSFTQAAQALAAAWQADRTALIEWQGGSFTRSDLIAYATENYGIESVVGSINRTECLLSSYAGQRAMLDEMVERMILLTEAEKEKFAERPEIRLVLEESDRRLLIPIHFQEVIAKQPLPPEAAVRTSHIFLRFSEIVADYRSPEPQLSPENRAVLEKARALHATLAAGGDFAETASAHSMDHTKGTGGELGWIVKSSMGEDYFRAASALAPGGLSGPVLTDAGVYLIRLAERGTVDGKNHRERLHSRFAFQYEEAARKQAETRFVEQLQRGPRVRINRGLLDGGVPEALLFEVDDYRLTLGEFERHFHEFAKGYKPETFAAEKRREWKERFLMQYLLIPRLLIRDALARGLDRLPAYRDALAGNEGVRRRSLYLEYRDHLFRTRVGEVSVERVKMLYDKYKEERYFTLVPLSPDEEKTVPEEQRVRKEDGSWHRKTTPPFEEVRGAVTGRIIEDMRHALLDAFVREKRTALGVKAAAESAFAVVEYRE
jgi:hypothetical protein